MRNSKKDTRQLLIEATEFASKINLSADLKESVKMSVNNKNNTLIVRNVPCTILNRVNQNGRIYSTTVLQAAIDECKKLKMFETKQILSQSDDHPQSSYVAPSHASHVVINAYIKPSVHLVVEGEEEVQDVLFMDWEVLNTEEGKNLRALLEAECSLGTSIRGVGDMNGKYVENYSLLGVDVVGQPSSSTYTRMPVSESVQVEVVDNRALNETYNVSSSSTAVVRDLDTAAELQKKIENIGFGTVTKTSTKVDQETDPKTGAQTSITTLEAETSDDVSDLDQALIMAKNAITNGLVEVDSVTIENIKEEQPKESLENPEVSLNEDDTCMTEAKEEDEKKGRKFVLKCPAGFAAIDGNTLVFEDDPEDAIHFVEGKEESGLIHLSAVKKILDAMGVYDFEKYCQDPSTNISISEPQEDLKADVIDGVANESCVNKLSEQDTSGGMFTANVRLIKDDGAEETSNVPVSATEPDSVLSEVSNLYDMKAKSTSGQVHIDIVNNLTGEKLHFDPTERSLVPVEQLPVHEAEGDIEQNDKTLSIQADANNTISKEFNTPAQASVVKAGIEQGKLPADIMLEDGFKPGYYAFFPGYMEGPYESQEDACNRVNTSDDGVDCDYVSNEDWEALNTEFTPVVKAPQKGMSEADRSYEDIKPGWYVSAQNVGVIGPFESEKEARSGLEDYANMIEVDYISPEDLGEPVDEVVFDKNSEPSDPFVQEPIQDSKELSETEATITVSDIDWDDSVIESILDGQFEDPYSKLYEGLDNLPDEMTLTVDISNLDDPAEVKNTICNEIEKQTGKKVNNVNIKNIQ